MKITEIKVFKANGSDVVMGNATVIFDNKLGIKVTIMKNKTGELFCNYPSRKAKDKEGNDKWYNDVFFIIDEELEDKKYEFKNSVDSAIIKEYNALVGMPSQDSKKQDEKKEDAPAEEKKKPLVSFKKK